MSVWVGPVGYMCDATRPTSRLGSGRLNSVLLLAFSLSAAACGDEAEGDLFPTTSASTFGTESTADDTAASAGEGGSASEGEGDSSSGGDGDSATSGDGDASTSAGDGDSSATGGDGDSGSSSTTGGDGDSGTTSGTGGDGDSGTTGTTGTTGGDGDGDLPPNGDEDDDGIPNGDDPFPYDPNAPVPGQGNVVYAHTSSTLHTMNVGDYSISTIGGFTGIGADQITDIALDRWGVLYAVSFNNLYVCDADTAACTLLASLPTTFNGLTMIPPGPIEPGDDVLVGIAQNGTWYRIDVDNGTASLSAIGGYGGSYTNSGDVFSIQGVGTFGAVDGAGGDIIVESDPATGAVQSELATLNYSYTYGLAGWANDIFAFDESGSIFRIDPTSGAVTEVATTAHAWWGAGVFSILPQ